MSDMNPSVQEIIGRFFPSAVQTPGSERTANVISSSVPVQAASQINPRYATYYRHLSLAGHGTPLWLPEPNETQDINYRRRGATIGDVILFTKNGGLHFLFNICLDAHDPINGNNVPQGFTPFTPTLHPNRDIYRVDEYGKGEALASKSITKRRDLYGPAGLWFTSSASEGAILTMPEGAYSEDLVGESRFDRYLADNLVSWYAYANEVREWGVEWGDIHLITGVHKAKAWGIATFSNETTTATDLRMIFKSNQNNSSGDLYSWEYDGIVDSTRAGPTQRQRDAIHEGLDEAQRQPFENQCLFVRAVNGMVRKSKVRESNPIVVPTSQAMIERPETRSADLESSGSTGLNRSSSLNGSNGMLGTSGLEQLGVQDNLSVLRNGAVLAWQRDHPSKAINNFLLKEKPNGWIAITHDQDWISLLREEDVSLPSGDELVERLKKSCKIIEHEGIISIDHEHSQSDTNSVDGLIGACLSLVPVPGLNFAFTTLRWVIATANQIQDSKEQIRNLTGSLAQLMLTVDSQYKKGKLLEKDTKRALEGLGSLVNDVWKFVEGQKKNSIFAQIITSKKRLDTIDSFHRRIGMSVNAFQIASLVDTQHLMNLNELARRNDQMQMQNMLRELQSNQRLLMEALDISKNEPLAMMAALERRISERPETNGQNDELMNFYTTSLLHLRTTSGKKVDLTPWTITSFDVEFGPQIGAGGFGTVYRAKWNEMEVAVKVMRNNTETIPRPVTVRREVDTWSRLRHPHILQFLGANILDDKPFIVTPLITGGNAAEYILGDPDFNRLRIVHQVSLGLTYLHSQRVVHGDIKCTNILIDDSGNALLCDFGLARIKAEVHSRSLYTNVDDSTQLGSQNWMAPELFEGSSLKMPCDIYSLGMTIYELYTGEVPLSHIHPVRLQEAVIHGTRPQKPEEYEAPQMTNATWALAEACWVKTPSSRPTAEDLCRDIKFVLESPPSPSPLDNPPLPIAHPSTIQTSVAPVHTPAYKPLNPSPNVPSLPPITSPEPPKRKETIILPPVSPISGRIRIVDPSLPTKRPWKKYLILKKNSNITRVELSPNQKVLLTGHMDGTLRVWDAWKGIVKREYSLGVNSIVTTVAFSPTNAIRYVAASKDPTQAKTSVYVVLKDKSMTMLHSDVTTISNLMILSDETIVGVERVEDEAFVILWKRQSGRTPSWDNGTRVGLLGLDTFLEPLAGCGFVISPDGKTIWTGNTSRSIFASMVETGQQNEHSLHLFPDEATSGPIHNQVNPLTNASMTSNGSTSTSTSTSSPAQSTSPELVRLACAPDGKKLAISYISGEILVLDLRSKKIKMIRGPKPTSHTNQGSSILDRAPPVIFSADGSRLIYPCNEQKKTIKIQAIAANSIPDSVFLSGCPANEEISSISVTPNFKHITVSFMHTTQALVYIWD